MQQGANLDFSKTDFTHIYTAHVGNNINTGTYKSKSTPPVICSQQLSLLHWTNNSLIPNINFQHSSSTHTHPHAHAHAHAHAHTH